jgi:DNA-binding response OmpR family regulator
MARILIVDDEPTVLNTLGYVFQARGYDTVLAANGAAALQLLDSVDAALIDINMPGMNGFAVCRAIRSDPKHANVQVWMMSGAYSDAAVHETRSAGALRLVPKPFKLIDLMTEINAVLSADQQVA